MKYRQLSYLPAVSLEHGGALRQGRRKISRPIDPKLPLHAVMRSSRARGELSMLHQRSRGWVDRVVRATAQKTGIRLLQFSNVGNHLHFLVLARTRKAHQHFLREVAGRVAMGMTGARKTLPEKFWDFLVYTRVIYRERDLRNLDDYFSRNTFKTLDVLNRVRTASERSKPPDG